MVSLVTIIVTKNRMRQNGGDCDVIGYDVASVTSSPEMLKISSVITKWSRLWLKIESYKMASIVMSHDVTSPRERQIVVNGMYYSYRMLFENILT